jgi:hypothetical protein
MSRSLHRRISFLALILWVATPILPTFVPHAGVLDFACADDAWASPHPTTQFERVLPPLDEDHCLVCHLQRMGSGAFAERIRILSTPDRASSGAVTFGHELPPERARRVPARAPPSSLL